MYSLFAGCVVLQLEKERSKIVCVCTLVYIFYLDSSLAVAFLKMFTKDGEWGGRAELLKEKYAALHLQKKLFWPLTGSSFLHLP